MAVLRGSGGADFTFEVKGLDEDLFRVLRVQGREGISTLFRFELELASLDEEVDFDAVVGHEATLVWKVAEGERLTHGIVERLEQTGRGRKLTRYAAGLVPRVWPLTLRRQSRVFQPATTPMILEQVLGEGGLAGDDYRLVMKRSYERRPFCVQYRESDFDFLARLLEEEGIFYFFEHGPERAVMVFADDATVHETVAGDPEVPFEEGEAGLLRGEAVHDFRVRQAMRVGAVTLREFDFEKPKLDLEVVQRAGDSGQEIEVYDFPGDYPHETLGKDLVKIRLEEQRARRRVATGAGDVRRLESGRRFTLRDHPRGDFDQEWLVLGVSHTAEQPQAGEEDHAGGQEKAETYANVFECIPATVPFRPARRTPLPRIEGPQTAEVTGPQGEEIHTDEHGRVKVRFHWDRSGPRDDKSSCWVRVSQGWAGAGWGGLFLPRVGQEVVVEFLEGDPDRPLVTGRVYNGAHPPPYPLPDEKTKSTIKSATSPGGGGTNELRFEDKKGGEEILLQAQKDLNLYVKGDRAEWIGRDRHLHVKRDRVETVERDEHRTVEQDSIAAVTRDRSRSVGGKESVEIKGTRSLTVTGDAHEAYRSDHSEEVSGKLTLKAMKVVVEGLNELTLKVGSTFLKLDFGGVTMVGHKIKLNSGGAPGEGRICGSTPVATPLEAVLAHAVADGRPVQGVQDERPAFKPPEHPAPNASWIELELVDEADQPVAGERWEVELPDGRVARGTTGADGVARVAGFEPGACKIRFPDLDQDAWEAI
jgi:type VI secretion system secreted protein VgrG